MENLVVIRQPRTIFKVIQKSINKILEKYDSPDHNKNIKLNFICHSLGCASCLYYINNENDPNIIDRIRKIILLAPFYTLKDVAISKYFMPKSLADILIRHKWDSHKNIKSLGKLSPDASLKIIHGSNDELIDISQGLSLFSEAPNSINKEFIETNDSHNSIAHLRHLISHVPVVKKPKKPKNKKNQLGLRQNYRLKLFEELIPKNILCYYKDGDILTAFVVTFTISVLTMVTIMIIEIKKSY